VTHEQIAGGCRNQKTGSGKARRISRASFTAVLRYSLCEVHETEYPVYCGLLLSKGVSKGWSILARRREDQGFGQRWSAAENVSPTQPVPKALCG